MSLSGREKIILGALAALLVAGSLWRVLQPAYGLETIERTDGAFENGSEQAGANPALLEEITVHVVGAVHNPGVYRLPVGSRVYEVLALAGGTTAEADLEKINLARPLMDGEQVKVYRGGEEAEPGSAKININRATAEELAELPGIGAVRAQQIVEHREKWGYFLDTAQIMEVRGVGQGTYDAIEDLITIY